MPPKETKREPSEYSYVTDEEGCAILFFCFFFVFWFFGFLVFWFFGFFGLCVDSPDLAHGSELFVFLFFFVLEVLAKLQKTMEKPKKNKKFRPMSPARPLPRPCPWV